MPPGVLMRLIQPWVRLRLRLFGWYSLPRAFVRICWWFQGDAGLGQTSGRLKETWLLRERWLPRGSCGELERREAVRSWKGQAATCCSRQNLWKKGKKNPNREVRRESLALPLTGI